MTPVRGPMDDLRVLVAIHDIAPATWDAAEGLWSLCRGFGVTPALLVVPDWHGEWPIERHPRFVDWLLARAADGAEIVLHGLRHDEVGLTRTWRDSLRAVGRTHREGEFLTLDEQLARRRIDEGLARLRQLGLEPVGFIPPAWLMRPACLRAVADAGLTVCEDDDAVYLRTRSLCTPTMCGAGVAPALRRIPSPVWRWSARSSVRAWSSAIVAGARRVPPLSDRCGVARIALHPGDLGHVATRRSVRTTLQRLTTGNRWLRYASLPSLADAEPRLETA